MKKVALIITVIVITTGLQAQVNYDNNSVTGTNASSLGENNESSGPQSFSSGKECISSGNQSVAMGFNSEASDFTAISIGAYNNASGAMSTALGSRCNTMATGSFAIGNKVSANATYSFVIGNGIIDHYLENNINHSLMIGFKSDVPTFFIGPGNGNQNSLGKVGIGTTTPAQLLDVAGTINVDGEATFGNDMNVTGKTSTSQLQITDGDVFIEDIDRGIIMKSPDGQCWRGTLDNSGSLNFTEIDCGSLTSANSNDNDLKEVNIYPNPAKNSITIKIDGSNEKLNVNIYNQSGSLVISREMNSNILKIKTGKLPAGNYIVTIVDKTGKAVKSSKIAILK